MIFICFLKKGCKSYTRVSCPQYRFCIFVCLFFVLSSTHVVQRDFLERSKNSNCTENDATVHERMILNTRLAKISFTFLLFCIVVVFTFLFRQKHLSNYSLNCYYRHLQVTDEKS